MNIDNINRLADVIEAQSHTDREAEDGFAMNCFFHTCGTPACIAGWADFLANGDEWVASDTLESRSQNVEGRAMEWLGMSSSQRYELFWGGTKIADLAKVTPTHAAAVLRHLAATGDVDWFIGA